MLAELTVGTELPQTHDITTLYDFNILLCLDELGGGRKLRLIENRSKAGGQVLSLVVDEGGDWWNGLAEAGRTRWLRRAPIPAARDAYITYLLDKGRRAVSEVAGVWLESRPWD
jgi:hypothetical protein